MAVTFATVALAQTSEPIPVKLVPQNAGEFVVDAVSVGSSGPNPNTQAEINAIQAPDAGSIPMKSTTGFVNSAITQNGSMVDVSMPTQFTDQGGINVGQWKVSNGASNILVTNSGSGQQFYPIASELQTAGSQLPRYFDFGAITITPSVADTSETFTGDTIQLMITNANTGSAESYTYNAAAAQT